MNSFSNRSARAYAAVGLDSRANANGPHEVALLLFEGLLDRIRLGKLAMEQHDLSNKIRHINKALQILGEGLRTHLDIKAGGELAQQLDTLYAYCSLRLLDANAHNDVAALDEVHSLIKPLADAWREARPAAGAPGTELPASPLDAGNATAEATAPYPGNYGAGRSSSGASSGLGGTLLRYAA